MTNRRNGTLYVGVTSNLLKRIWEHRNNFYGGFTNRYQCHILVYYEFFDEMTQAIMREKQIKAGSREKKIKLILKSNDDWRDLYETLV